MDPEDIAERIIKKFILKEDFETLKMMVSKNEWNIYKDFGIKDDKKLPKFYENI